MALDFSGSGQYLTSASAFASAAPLTVAGWFWVDDLNNDYDIFSIGNSANDTNAFLMRVAGAVGGDPLRIVATDGGAAGIADSTIAVTAAAWHHGAAVFASTSSHTVYLDGANNATSATAATPTVNQSTFGAFRGASLLNAFNGRLAEWGAWNAGLDAGEVLALSKGVSPLMVRPQALIAYWPIHGNNSPELDNWKNSFPLTLVGPPTKIDHPRIIYPQAIY